MNHVRDLPNDDPRYITWLYLHATNAVNRIVTFEGQSWMVESDGTYYKTERLITGLYESRIND